MHMGCDLVSLSIFMITWILFYICSYVIITP